MEKPGKTVDFYSEPEAGRKRGQSLSTQRDEEHADAHEDHVGRLCGLASSGAEMKEDGELPERVRSAPANT